MITLIKAFSKAKKKSNVLLGLTLMMAAGLSGCGGGGGGNASGNSNGTTLYVSDSLSPPTVSAFSSATMDMASSVAESDFKQAPQQAFNSGNSFTYYGESGDAVGLVGSVKKLIGLFPDNAFPGITGPYLETIVSKNGVPGAVIDQTIAGGISYLLVRPAGGLPVVSVMVSLSDGNPTQELGQALKGLPIIGDRDSAFVISQMSANASLQGAGLK